MAIKFMDNFSLYGSDESLMLNGLYAQINSVSAGTTLVPDPDTTATGTVVAYNSSTSGVGSATRVVLPTAQQIVGAAGRVWFNNLPTEAGISGLPFVFCDVDNNILCSLRVTTTGALNVVLSSSSYTGTVIASTAGPVLVANAWQHVEMWVKAHSSTGTVEVRVDGVTVIDEVGLNTSNGPTEIAQVRQDAQANGSGQGVIWHLKDYIILDNTGSSNNDFIGTVQVVTLTPNGDNSFNWDASTGTTGYNLIDEAPPNDDTDYISASNPPPTASSFNLSNLPVDVTSVKGLQTVVRARKTDGGDGNLQVSLISGASTVDGSDRPITVAYTYWYDVFETDPATAAAWTPVAVDAVKLKVNRTT